LINALVATAGGISCNSQPHELSALVITLISAVIAMAGHMGLAAVMASRTGLAHRLSH